MSTFDDGAATLADAALGERARRWSWQRISTTLQLAIDATAWLIALPLAAILRYDLSSSPVAPRRLLAAVAVALVMQLLAGAALGLYRGRWRFGSFDEVSVLARSTAITGVALLAASSATDPHLVPRGAGITGSLFAFVLLCGARYGWRLAAERRLRPSAERNGAVPMLVFGAGDGAAQILPSLLRTPSSPYVPVALLDDDPAKRRLRMMGLRVRGTADDLDAVAADTGAKVLLIAIPSATADLVRAVSERAQHAGLRVLVLPPVNELFGALTIADIRPLSEADLLGRHAVETDLASIAGYITGRRVLVTGAGGSIGSELCRQLHRYGPASLVMLDRDESALHGVQLSIEGRALLDSPELVLADLRDAKAIEAAFKAHRPEVVFHAAALKHLPLLERHPSEAVKTNILGTQIVLEAAMAAGVDRFVNISTDKAADPISVLGYSKRITERLTASAAARTGRPYLSVRFGNVLGSRGSFLRTFEAQIAAGGPITVTHPDVTRYFMTVEEAVQLTIQAGAIGRPAEVLVLDMGEPVRIADVAERLISQADRPVRIEFTHLRHGEKLHEALFGSGEVDVRPIHPLISHCAVPAIAPEQLQFLPIEGVTGEELRTFCLIGTTTLDLSEVKR